MKYMKKFHIKIDLFKYGRNTCLEPMKIEHDSVLHVFGTWKTEILQTLWTTRVNFIKIKYPLTILQHNDHDWKEGKCITL